LGEAPQPPQSTIPPPPLLSLSLSVYLSQKRQQPPEATKTTPLAPMNMTTVTHQWEDMEPHPSQRQLSAGLGEAHLHNPLHEGRVWGRARGGSTSSSRPRGECRLGGYAARAGGHDTCDHVGNALVTLGQAGLCPYWQYCCQNASLRSNIRKVQMLANPGG
jgi:hypothetical protein